MRWIRAAGRGLLVAAVVLTGYVASGAQADGAGRGGGRGPLTLATAGDLTGYLGPLLEGWNRTHPGEKVTLVELPDSADETHAQMTTDLRAGDRGRFDVLNIDVGLDLGVRRRGLDPPAGARPLPAEQLPAAGRGHGDVRRTAVRRPVRHQRRAAPLPQGHPRPRRASRPPRTWAELERQAKTIAPKYGLDGYAGQFLPYEGLTVNAAEAVYSAGGTILGDEGERVTVDSAAAREGIGFLARGVRDGWIPREGADVQGGGVQAGLPGRPAALPAQLAVRLRRRRPPRAPRSPGRSAPCRCPGRDGPGTSVLGGSNLAVSAHARHPDSAARLIAYLTSERVQRQVLTAGALPPVRADALPGSRS